MRLLRYSQAQCGVIDRQVQQQRWQPQAALFVRIRLIPFAVRSDLLDVDWRLLPIKQEVARIDYADAFPMHEPNLPIGRLGHVRRVTSIVPDARHSVGAV